jgi:phosphoribosyl 1,2-cyclic phosphodiesterase
MILVPLQSGSNGNCIFVESSNASLLFDAGISGLCAGQRLAVCGKSLAAVDALFITHEHSDHIRYARTFAGKYQLPLYITEKTFQRARRRFGLDGLPDVRFFRAGDEIRIKDTLVRSMPTPHDAVDGSVFVVSDGQLQLGVFTDLGHVFAELESVVPHLDGMYIESNYDPGMLRNGSYPAVLKRRISGRGGHISNTDVARLVAKHAAGRLQWVCLGHLSEENNTPELALATFRRKVGPELPVGVASRYEPGPAFHTTCELFNLQPIRQLKKADSAGIGVYGQQLDLFGAEPVAEMT